MMASMMATIFNPALWAGLMALVYALVGAYVLLAQGSVLVRTPLLTVLAASIAWGVLVAQPDLFNFSGGFPAAFYALAVVLVYAWYAFIHRLLRGPYEQSMPEVVRRLLRLFWVVVLGASGLVALLTSEQDTPWQGTLFSVSAAGIALIGLALAAQLGRDTPVESRTAYCTKSSLWLALPEMISASRNGVLIFKRLDSVIKQRLIATIRDEPPFEKPLNVRSNESILRQSP